MSTGMFVSGHQLHQPVRATRIGTWHLGTGPRGQPAGILHVHPDADLDLLVEVTLRLRTLALPGLLRVHDLVRQYDHSWLLVDDGPVPTLSDLLGGTPLDATTGLQLLGRLGDALLGLHVAGLAHGAVTAGSVVVRPDAAVLLSDWGTVADPAPVADAFGWAEVAEQLAPAWARGDHAAEALLRKVADLARSTGDLQSAIVLLRAGTAEHLASLGAATLRVAALPIGLPAALEEATMLVAGRNQGAVGNLDETLDPVDEVDPLTIDAGARSLLAAPVAAAAVPPSALGETERIDPALAIAAPAAVPASAEPVASPVAAAAGTGDSSKRAGVRFGPGVPESVAEQTWRSGAAARPGRSRSKAGRARLPLGLLVLVVLAGAAVLWWSQRQDIDVTAVAVQVDQPAQGCDGTAHLVGVIATSGDPGTVSYRWNRSDTGAGPLQEQSVGTERETRVALQWTFHGRGAVDAKAELEILAPRPMKAEAHIAYSCQ